MRTTNPWLMLFAAWQACSLAALGDDASDLVRHAESFEQTRRAGDWETLRRLVHLDASSLDAKGRELRRLRKDLQSESKRIQEDPASDQTLLRIVQRDVVLHGDAAIVTEMIGAVMGAGENTVVPLRRTLVWIRSDHNGTLAHLHASPYARWEPSITAFEAQDTQDFPEASTFTLTEDTIQVTTSELKCFSSTTSQEIH